MAEKKGLESPLPRTRQGELPHRTHRHVHWVWPLGLAIAGIGGAATFLLRGCWHTRMSWPLRADDEFSYQVCTDCGIKRLYDERTFHAYGPHSYDLHELIAHERASRLRRWRKHQEEMAKAGTPGSPPRAEAPEIAPRQPGRGETTTGTE